MPNSSFVQKSFLGGEWSPSFQGRLDHPQYHTAMNVCRNAIPVEQGACARRSGTRVVATTRNGGPAAVRNYTFKETLPYNLEFTAGHIRASVGAFLVFDDAALGQVVSISTANPAVVTLTAAMPSSWVTGDQVQFAFDPANDPASGAILQNRQFSITVLTTTTFSIADPITGLGIDGSLANIIAGSNISVMKVLDIAVPYTLNDLATIRTVQGEENEVFILHGLYRPKRLALVQNSGSPIFAHSTLTDVHFADGPYLDPVAGALATPSATSGTITVTVSFQTWSSLTTYAYGDIVTFSGVDYQSIADTNLNHQPDVSPTFWSNLGAGFAVSKGGFVSTDVGRLIRIHSEPATWSSATAYVAGNNVLWNGTYYTAVSANTNKQPDLNPTIWTINLEAQLWSWGEIVSVISAVAASVQLLGPNLLYSGGTQTFQLGVYSDTTGWPTNGTFHEGRLWLAGSVSNRFDASKSNANLNFSPTGQDGTVADDNAISYTIASNDQNTISWFMPDHRGIVAGSLGGEWLIQASTFSDPLTPTSIQAHRISKFGASFVEPQRTNIAIMFVQKYLRQIKEMITDVFTGRFAAPNLTLTALHLTGTGLAEIRYQDEIVPVLWARMYDGSLAGVTYRRTSSMATQDPAFAGWHRHDLGSGRVVESISVGPNSSGNLEVLTMVTNQTNSSAPDFNVRWLEVLEKQFEETDVLTSAWFLDGANPATGYKITTVGGVDQITLYGFYYLKGQTVTGFIGGLDAGQATVQSDGSLVFKLDGTANSLLTTAYLNSLVSAGTDFGEAAVPVSNVSVTQTAQAGATQTTITSYPVTDASGFGTAGPFGVVDWKNGKLYAASGNDIKRFNLSTRTEEGQLNWAGSGITFQSEPFAMDGKGHLYQPGLAGTFTLQQIVGSTLTLGTSLANVSQTRSPNAFAAASSNADYVVNVTINQSLQVIQADPTMKIISDRNGGDFSIPARIQTGGAPHASCGATIDPASTVVFYTVAVNPQNTIDLYRTVVMDALPTLTQSKTKKKSNSLWGFLFQSLLGLGGKLAFNSLLDSPLLASGFSFGFSFLLGFLANFLFSFLFGGGSKPSVSAPYVQTVKVGTFAATAIDPTWTSANLGPFTLGWDGSDGNVILGASTSDVVTNTHYFVKLSTKSAAVLWTVPIQGDQGTLQLKECSLTHGVLAFMPAHSTSTANNRYPYYIINTFDGSYVVLDTFGIPSPNTGTVAPSQDYSDSTFQTVFFGDDNGSTTNGTPPVPQGGTVVPFTQLWYSLVVGSNSPADPTIVPVKLAATVPTGFTFTVSTVNGGSIPAIVGYSFTTQGQLLRPWMPQDVGTAAGPGFGKQRRVQKLAALFQSAVSSKVKVGTNFSKLHPAVLTSPGGTPFTDLQLFNGMYKTTIDDDSSMDGMLCWQIDRPVPGTVVALGGFIATQDE